MNIDKQNELIRQNIATESQKIAWLESRRDLLTTLPDGLVFGENRLDFDRLDHGKVIEVVKALGGEWKKKPTDGVDARIDYEAEIDGMTVRCWAGEPPPSCRIVEVDEEVPAEPATVRKVKKLVCKEPDPPESTAPAESVAPEPQPEQ